MPVGANLLNAATGALGRWAWSVAFVVWLALASGALTLEQWRRHREGASPPGGAGASPPPMAAGEAR